MDQSVIDLQNKITRLTKELELKTSPLTTPIETEHSAPIDIKYPVRDGNVMIPFVQRDLYVPVAEDNVVIHFASFQSHIVKKSDYDKYPMLRQPNIERSYQKFIKYIVPILNGDHTVMTEALDSMAELGEFITEINAYEISLTEEEILQVHISSGVVELINEMKI